MRAKRSARSVGSPKVGRIGWGRLRDAAWIFAVVFAFYALGAIIAWQALFSHAGRGFFFPPAGVTVAAAMLARRSQWPAILAAIVLGELSVDLVFGTAPAAIAGYSLANTVEPIVGATLAIRWCGRVPDVRDRADLVTFVAGACLIGPAVGGLIGGTTTHLVDQSRWVESVAHWWMGDGLGVLVVATPILLWTKQSSIVRDRTWETSAVMLLTAGMSAAAFAAPTPPSILILPLLAWAALRLDMLGAALTGGVVAFVTTIMASRGQSLLQSADLSPSARLMLNQLNVAVIMTVALLVAQEASARSQAVRERETERRQRIQLEGLSQLAQQLSAALTPEDIGRALKNHVLKEAGAQGVALGLLSPDGSHLNWVAAPGYPQQVQAEFNPRSELDTPLLGTEVVREGKPVMIRNKAEYKARYGDSVRWLHMSETQSMAGWPLTGGGRPFGALLVIWAESQKFDPAQVAYLSAVTTMVSQALVRARIYADEHARAAVLQSALVPENPTDKGGVDVCVVYEPAEIAEGLGGDWYDVLSLPKNRIYFAVGDVIGHGLPAVEDMAQLRTAGRALAHHGLPPSQLLAELNAFARRASQGKFATMAVAVFDSLSGELTYGTAGHPPPLLRRAATGEVLRLSDTAGAVLGPLTETNYVEGSLKLSGSDVLVMYTDGLVERPGVDIDTGISCAARLIADWDMDSPLAGNCEALQETLSPRPRDDDVCIIAVRFPELCESDRN